MGAIIRRNERSWAIDLISEINIMLHGLQLKIKKAGGESTLSVNKKSMFPDVLLFADENQARILQGWELKLPDTLITDTVFIKDAMRKAEALNLNSFFIWNFTCGKLYVRQETGSYEVFRSWNGTSFIKNREDVTAGKELWLPIMKEIVLELNEFFVSGTIRSASFADTLTDNVLMNIIERNKDITAVRLRESCSKNMVMERKLLQWWQLFRMEYMQDEKDLYSAYAKMVLLNWSNRILFAHIIKKYHNCAREAERIDDTVTPAEANQIMEEITARGDFYNVFKAIEFNEIIPDEAWSDLVDLNGFITRNGIDTIDQTLLQQLLEKTVSASRREIRGQFTTPPWLAGFLCQITVNDWSGQCADVCSGTGTIGKAVINNKIARLNDIQEAFRTTWISDKYSYPLQISNIGLTNIGAINVPVHVFQRNAFELGPDEEIQILSPVDGSKIALTYPVLDAIVSNLPFVKANAIDPEEKAFIERIACEVRENTGEVLNPGKSDLYCYLPFAFHRLLAEGGRLGIIISNSWLGTAAGTKFYHALLYYYNICSVVLSGRGKWFKNAEVVATILVLEKKAISRPAGSEEISFFLVRKDMWEVAGADYETIISSIVLREELDPGLIHMKNYTVDGIEAVIGSGISLNALFHTVEWIEEIAGCLIPVTRLFDVRRGERRGWNALFYPGAGNGIEECYLKPVLKSPGHLKNYIAGTDAQAFCCHCSKEELYKKGHMGALRWIERFEDITNGTGRLLPEVLNSRSGYWYEMDDQAGADLVTALNPGRRLFVARFKEASFVDQRFTRLLVKEDTVDIRLSHALLNSVFGMFAIEAVGFGRGLGVLDASSSNFKSISMLDPRRLEKEDAEDIIRLFTGIEARGVLDTPDEMQDTLREEFDRRVLKAFGIESYYEEIRNSLLSMQQTRLAVMEQPG